jgi:hypothetical protein
VNALAAVIAALLFAAPVPRSRVIETAAQFEAAAKLSKVKVSRLVALGYYESTFNHRARSRVGALGMMQLLNPKYVRPWRADCKLKPSECDAANVVWGAWALRDSLQQCGTYLRAFGHYRTGRCVAGPRAHATMRLAEQIEFRLKRPSTAPLRARRLP